MKEILKFGLVMGVLLCAAIGVASAQETLSEDYKEGYKDGFYRGATTWFNTVIEYSDLANLYNQLGGQPTNETAVFDNETMTWSDFYNERATIFNEEIAPSVNSLIMEIYGPDDNRTELFLIPDLELIP